MKNKNIIKRTFNSLVEKSVLGEVNLPSTEEVIEALPEEMWDTWESADSEIRNIITELRMNYNYGGGKVRHKHQVRHIRRSKKGKRFVAGHGGKWIRRIIDDSRYEYVKKPYTIDVNIGREQGYPGSNQVSVYGGEKYGGWLLNTPKSFRTKKETINFVKLAKKLLDMGKEGRRVPFPI